MKLCFDRPDGGALRGELVAAHRAYLQPHLAADAVVKLEQGGTLATSDADATTAASFMILDAPSEADVVAFHAADPFTLGGLYARVHIHPWQRHVDQRR